MTKLRRLLYVLLFGFAVAGWAQTPPVTAQRFQFREPRLRHYRVEQPLRTARAPAKPVEWLKAWPENGSSNYVETSSRLVIHLKPGTDVNRLLAGRRLKID